VSAPAPAAAHIGTAQVVLGDALSAVADWPTPTAIIVDGPYGVSGYPGDPPTPQGLPAWYEDHIAAWSEQAGADTTLWFWGTEISWALVHPVLVAHGWEYRTFNVWDKGIAHVAGNVNGNTIRRFPIVTEACVQYTRVVTAETAEGDRLPLQQWLRHEWQRTGMPLYKTNEAAGVANAATRKYFTADHLWYFPPADVMERIAAYANEHGVPTGRPYFSLDGRTTLTAREWARMRAKWNHKHGVCNVWREPAVRGAERLKDAASKVLHTNQKPLRLMELIVEASTDPGDVVWEPFGGLCTGSVAAMRLGRRSFAAEVMERPFQLAVERLERELQALDDGDDR